MNDAGFLRRATPGGDHGSGAGRDGGTMPPMDLATDTACFHCGQPVTEPGRWSVRFDGAMRPLCCAGCEAVATAILDSGLDDYYRHRSAPAAVAADPQAQLDELRRLGLYDDPQVQKQFVQTGDDGVECSLALEGMRCGACVWLIERALRDVPGVRAVSVNYATERAALRFDPEQVRLSTLLARIRDVGYRALPFDARRAEIERTRASRAMARRLFVAGLGMMQVMMYAVPVYFAAPGDIDPEFITLMQWASLLLTLPVVLYSAAPFFAGAWRDLVTRRPGMDTPVALGIAAAFAASVHATITGRGEVYFDSVTMFVALLLGARWLEWVVRRRAGRAVDGLAAALPDSIERLRANGGTDTVAAMQAQVGDRFRVAAGERVALDARVVDGVARVDQSLLTGESVPVPVHAGEEVAGGSINAGDPFVAEVVRVAHDSLPSVMQRLIDRASADKPRVAAVADRIAGVFVGALLVLAAGAWLWWHLHDPARALPIAIAVLVVSCPCALSLATPAALAAATGALLGKGLLVTRGQALEALAGVTDVVFDKTGTLTRGRPALVAVACLPDGTDADGRGAAVAAPTRDDALRIAVALEVGSSHPFAVALREAWDRPIEAAGLPRSLPGAGVAGRVDGTLWVLGSARLAGAQDRAGDHADSEVWLGRVTDADVGDARGEAAATQAAAHAGADAESDVHSDARSGTAADPADAYRGRVRPVARFVLRDEIRDDAPAGLQRLREAGLQVHLLSGDREAAVRAAAQRLGIAHAKAEARPMDKLLYVDALQKSGRRVLMVGDGLNDAPVLAAADASIAVSDAASLARVAADMVSVRPGVDQVAQALAMARRTRRVVAQNLGWALAYNAVAIPAAALGWVPPWVAAVGMSTSSLAVALNALRLWSWNRSSS